MDRRVGAVVVFGAIAAGIYFLDKQQQDHPATPSLGLMAVKDAHQPHALPGGQVTTDGDAVYCPQSNCDGVQKLPVPGVDYLAPSYFGPSWTNYTPVQLPGS